MMNTLRTNPCLTCNSPASQIRGPRNLGLKALLVAPRSLDEPQVEVARA